MRKQVQTGLGEAELDSLATEAAREMVIKMLEDEGMHEVAADKTFVTGEANKKDDEQLEDQAYELVRQQLGMRTSRKGWDKRIYMPRIKWLMLSTLLVPYAIPSD